MPTYLLSICPGDTRDLLSSVKHASSHIGHTVLPEILLYIHMESLQLSFGLSFGLGEGSRAVSSLLEEWTTACTRARSTGPLSLPRPTGRSVFKGQCFSTFHQLEKSNALLYKYSFLDE